MLGWLSAWWSAGTVYGPARNAPNEGRDIARLFAAKSFQVIALSQEELEGEIKKLKHVEVNADRYVPEKTEFEVAIGDPAAHFARCKERRRGKGLAGLEDWNLVE